MENKQRAAASAEDAAFEEEFTRRNTWVNFKMALFGATSMATLFAALQIIAQKVIGAAEGVGAAVTAAPGAAVAAEPASFFGALFTNPI